MGHLEWNRETVMREFGEYVSEEVLDSIMVEVSRVFTRDTTNGKMQQVRQVLRDRYGLKEIPFKSYRG